MQGTTEFHHQIAGARLPQAEPVFDDTATLDTAVDVLDQQPPLVERLVRPLLLQGQLLTAGLLRRHEDHHFRERERQETQILQQPTPRREGVGAGLCDAQIMGAAAIGVTEKEDDEQSIHEQDIFYCMVLFLAAITRFLFSRVLGADDAPFGAVMGKKGASGVATGAAATEMGSSSNALTTEAASASETPSPWASAVRERAGASPRVRRAASSTGRSTWIH